MKPIRTLNYRASVLARPPPLPDRYAEIIKKELEIMCKPELLLDIVTNLRSLATSLETASATMLLDAEKDTAAPITKEEPSTPESPAPETSVPEPPATEPSITLEQVRAFLADKSLAGFTEQIQGLLKKHGAERLSLIDPEKYPALLADAEALK